MKKRFDLRSDRLPARLFLLSLYTENVNISIRRISAPEAGTIGQKRSGGNDDSLQREKAAGVLFADGGALDRAGDGDRRARDTRGLQAARSVPRDEKGDQKVRRRGRQRRRPRLRRRQLPLRLKPPREASRDASRGFRSVVEEIVQILKGCQLLSRLADLLLPLLRLFRQLRFVELFGVAQNRVELGKKGLRLGKGGRVVRKQRSDRAIALEIDRRNGRRSGRPEAYETRAAPVKSHSVASDKRLGRLVAKRDLKIDSAVLVGNRRNVQIALFRRHRGSFYGRRFSFCYKVVGEGWNRDYDVGPQNQPSYRKQEKPHEGNH